MLYIWDISTRFRNTALGAFNNSIQNLASIWEAWMDTTIMVVYFFEDH